MKLTCCTAWRAMTPSGLSWRHSKSCPVSPMAHAGVRVSTRRAGVATPLQSLGAGNPGSLPTSCGWHAGVEYTVGGICNGPRCRAFRDAHMDDRDGAA